MKYMYKNASVEAVNHVNYYRSLIKSAASDTEWLSALIGAGLGAGAGGGLGYLLAPDKKKSLWSILLGMGLGGGLGGKIGRHWGVEEIPSSEVVAQESSIPPVRDKSPEQQKRIEELKQERERLRKAREEGSDKPKPLSKEEFSRHWM